MNEKGKMNPSTEKAQGAGQRAWAQTAGHSL